ncbi:metal-dependent hydrolase [Thermococcus thermotolerans]|uniref:metal-dependent hydrolase n=1 Tax=Thermococcus thermotolerans TaxID=2969672 RepID=UPI002157178E|nr:metal-dependent hydrolase [Thermococcus thermotolerans]
MPNYDAHLLSGIVSYPLTVFIAFVLRDYAGIPFTISTFAMVIGYALYVLGADLPDMDHPNALIHRGTKPIVAVAVGSAVFMQSLGSINLGGEPLNVAAAWGVGTLAGVIAWYGFTVIMPKHRGIVHSLLFAAIYGALAFIMVEYGLSMARGEGLYVGFAAFSGYTLHLLLDREVSLV